MTTLRPHSSSIPSSSTSTSAPRTRLSKRHSPFAAIRKASDPHAPLVLDGDELELISVALDGALLRDNAYSLSPERLVIPLVRDVFTLETTSRIVPQRNTKLEGLYATKTGFVTQCEAQGFRRITWFIDRPDGDGALHRLPCMPTRPRSTPALQRQPCLFGDEPGGRHWAKWDDPFPKPSYLFRARRRQARRAGRPLRIALRAMKCNSLSTSSPACGARAVDDGTARRR